MAARSASNRAAEPKVGRRDGPQSVERFLRPAIAARSRRALRQAVVQHQGQVLFQPVQADGPEWNVPRSHRCVRLTNPGAVSARRTRVRSSPSL